MTYVKFSVPVFLTKFNGFNGFQQTHSNGPIIPMHSMLSMSPQYLPICCIAGNYDSGWCVGPEWYGLCVATETWACVKTSRGQFSLVYRYGIAIFRDRTWIGSCGMGNSEMSTFPAQLPQPFTLVVDHHPRTFYPLYNA